MPATLNVIGAGRVGRTLAALWHRSGLFEIAGVLNRSAASSRDAVRFIGAGRTVTSMTDLQRADVHMISVGDDAIAQCCEELASACDLDGATVFHCSGSLPSMVLAAASTAGASVASVHPVKTFANPDECVTSFPGTYCGYEGDEQAVGTILPAFEGIGGHPFPIVAERKTVYHAAAVFAMNYLVALLEVGVGCYQDSGVERDLALRLLEPLVRSAVDNVFEHGTAPALTGPIARGDVGVVARHVTELAERDVKLARLYALLGEHAVELSRQADSASTSQLQSILDVLRKHDGS